MSAAGQYSYLRPQPKIGLAFFASVAVHVGCVAALLLWPTPQTTADTLKERAIVTRLVKLGRELDKKELPRLDSYQPPTADDRHINVDKEAQAADAQKKKEERKDDKKRQDEFAKSSARAIQKLLAKASARNELGTGSPDGSAYGDALVGAEGDAYLTQIHSYIRNNYAIPSIISDAERKTLKASLVIYIDSSGRLVKSVFETRSGNVHFDNALESAIKKASPFPAPPEKLRKVYKEQGIGVNFSI